MKRIAMTLPLMVLIGCTGVITTRRLQSTDGQTEGVIFYEPTYVRLRYDFMALVDKDGKLLGTAPKDCTPVRQKDEVQIMADFAKPYAINQSQGFLTSEKFGVKLNNGLLAEVNMESTSNLPALITALAPIIAPTPPGAAATPPSAACNASPTLTSFSRIKLDQLAP